MTGLLVKVAGTWRDVVGSAPNAQISGGTSSTYTGNGTNGVSGTPYKFSQFTADGSLVCTQAGLCSLALVGPGGYGGQGGYYAGYGGGGGQVIYLPEFWLPVGTHAIVVGQPGLRPGDSNPNNDKRKAYGTSTKLGVLLVAIPGGPGADYAGANAGWAGGSGGGSNGDASANGGLGLAGFDGGKAAKTGLDGNASGGGATAPGTGRNPEPTTANPIPGGAGLVIYLTGTAVEWGKGGSTYGNGDQTAAATPSLPGHGGHGVGQPGSGNGPRSGFRGEVVVRVVNA